MSKFNAGSHSPFLPYIIGQFVVVTVCVTGLLLLEKKLTLAQQAPLAIFAVSGLFLFGALLESRVWANKIELLRVLSLPLMIAAAGFTSPLNLGIGVAIAVTSALWVSRIRRENDTPMATAV